MSEIGGSRAEKIAIMVKRALDIRFANHVNLNFNPVLSCLVPKLRGTWNLNEIVFECRLNPNPKTLPRHSLR